MHIPASMLHGAICPVTAGVSAVSLGVGAFFAYKQKEKPSVFKFIAVASLVFAMQMLNFPIASGTSGHLLGASLMVYLLGLPFAAMAMGVILLLQAVFLGDGGITTLGANIFNMGIVATVVSSVVYDRMLAKRVSSTVALSVAAWGSVVAASAVCAFELAACGVASLSRVLPAMVSVHSLIGISESVLTLMIVALVKGGEKAWGNNHRLAFGVLALALAAFCLTQFSSTLPDGLEHVMALIGKGA